MRLIFFFLYISFNPSVLICFHHNCIINLLFRLNVFCRLYVSNRYRLLSSLASSILLQVEPILPQSTYRRQFVIVFHIPPHESFIVQISFIFLLEPQQQRKWFVCMSGNTYAFSAIFPKPILWMFGISAILVTSNDSNPFCSIVLCYAR